MSITIRLTTILFVIVYYTFLIYSLKKKKLALKYSLLWIFSGMIFLIVAICPNILVFTTSLIGIEVPSNGLFAMLITSVILILMSLTVAISDITAKNKTLTQKIALMEKRIRELENIHHTQSDI